MPVRIKTISNDVPGAKKPERHGAHKPKKSFDASGQSDKILELEWEALGRKLHKHAEPEKLRHQLKELNRQLKAKDEMLKQANHQIATLKKQLSSLQEKQHAHKPQHISYHGFNAPAQRRK
jgi:predicted nuclease with TOPRIM domain